MAYATITNWSTTEWNDELVSIAQEKFVPLIMSCGAARVQAADELPMALDSSAAGNVYAGS